MSSISLIIITENQNKKDKAEKLAEITRDESGSGWGISRIEKYYNFEDSWKIEFERAPEIVLSMNHIALIESDKIVSPWLAYIDSEKNVE